MSLSSKVSPLSRVYAWFGAIQAEDITLLNDLLAHGVPINVRHPLRHSTALMEAACRGRATTVQWLLEQGAAPGFLGGSPLRTALHWALRHRHWHLAIMLTEAMEHCALTDASGATPLYALCAEATELPENNLYERLATLMIEKGCALDMPDHEGITALHHCVMNDARQMASILLSYSADANVSVPESGVTPLIIAALDKNIEMARLLIRYGANTEVQTREGQKPSCIFPAIAKLTLNPEMSDQDIAASHSTPQDRHIH